MSTEIANLALGRLEVGAMIASLSDPSTQAKLCNRFMAHCRQEVLQAFPWSIASWAVPLSAEADQTYPGWAYVYGYPIHALAVRAVSDSSGIRNITTYVRGGRWSDYETLIRSQAPFQIALREDLNARVILSDMPSAFAFVTYDVTNTAVLPPDMKSVIAWRLAMEVGGPLGARRDLVTNARNEYLFWKSHAAARDLNERGTDTPQESPSISCRM